jgi:hypothetical protein
LQKGLKQSTLNVSIKIAKANLGLPIIGYLLDNDFGKLMADLENLCHRVSAITGFDLPRKEILEQLIEELLKFLTEPPYNKLTIEEVLLAFRFSRNDNMKYSSGLDIEFPTIQGSHISVYYFSKVLSIYLRIKKHILQELQILAEKDAEL